MSGCDRFEREGLLRLERGQPLDPHFESCPDCLAARARYERLRAELAEVGSNDRPADAWQAGVWNAIRQRAGRRRRRRIWLLAPAGAAALAVLLLLRAGPETALEPSIAVRVVDSGDAPRRGRDAQPGDRLELRGVTGGAGFAELRVYLNETELVLRCSSEPPCERRPGELRAVLELRWVGSYQAALFAGDEPFPEPLPDLDADAGRVLERGARVELAPTVRVR